MVHSPNGVHDLISFFEETAHEVDEKNSSMGLGIKLMFGIVVNSTPNTQIYVEGLGNLVEDTFSIVESNLLIPDNLKLTVGDRVCLVPCDNAQLWAVLFKTRGSDTQPNTRVRFGYNGDRNSSDGTFAGVELRLDSGDSSGSSSLVIQAETITISVLGGSGVTIDGINFKNHVHSGVTTGSGNTGGPH